MTASVIIVTLDRHECVRTCLTRLDAQTRRAEQIIVVDASANEVTRHVVAGFPEVVYLQNSNGFGRMTASRNIGLKRAVGDVIAFLDDDAFAHPAWLENLLDAYDDPTVGAVGGRALNGQPGEATEGVDQIGQLKPDGTLTGYFAANPGQIIEVDHVMGCNMSFRREVLARLGGFRTDYPGISGVREDSDMCLRVKQLGYRVLFHPDACVDHVGAPQAKGRRFDWRYVYYVQRNHAAMLIRNFGPAAAIVWRNLAMSALRLSVEFGRRIAAASARLGAGVIGVVLGAASGVCLRTRTGRDPVRRDAEGEAIRAALTTNTRAPSKETAAA
jgi:GT2 family glycosyltransferase